MTIAESEAIGKFLDTQVMRATRFEIKESNFMKAQSKAKELAASGTHSVICEICKVFRQLFQTMQDYWRLHAPFRRDLLEAVIELVDSGIPGCRIMPHPITVVHQTCLKMVLSAITTGGSGFQKDLSPRIEALYTGILQRDISYTTHCATKDQLDGQLMVRYPADRAMRTKMFKFFVERQSLGFQGVCKVVLNEMLHSLASVKADSFRTVEALEYPLRSEAIEFITFVLASRSKSDDAAKTLIAELAAMNFVKKERALTDADDNCHLVNSSMAILSLLLANRDLLDDTFIRRATAQLESLRIRFSGTWNPELISDSRRGEAFPRPVTPKADARPGTTLPKLRGSTGLLAKNGPKIVTVKTGGSRAATSIGFRKK
jgi:hypothetical protein